MQAAERAIRANKQQREQWRAELGKILAEQKTTLAPNAVGLTAAEMLAAVREATEKKPPIKREVPLRRPKITIRVRPLAASGGHSNEGERVSKRLASWDNGCVVLEDEVGMDNGSVTGVRSQSYTYPQEVLGPDAKQVEVHRAAAAGLVKAVCSDGFNGLLFAYGQTGTGKTHTIFVCSHPSNTHT